MSLGEKEKSRERSAAVSPPSKAGCTGCKGRRAPRASGYQKIFLGKRNYAKKCTGGLSRLDSKHNLVKRPAPFEMPN